MLLLEGASLVRDQKASNNKIYIKASIGNLTLTFLSLSLSKYLKTYLISGEKDLLMEAPTPDDALEWSKMINRHIVYASSAKVKTVNTDSDRIQKK